MDARTEVEFRLFVTCARCFGHGRINAGPTSFKCDWCDGFGYHPTEDGSHVAKFLSIFYGLSPKQKEKPRE